MTFTRALRTTHAPMLCRWSHIGTFSSMQRQLWNDLQSLEFGKWWLFSITCSSDGVGSAAFLLTISYLCFLNNLASPLTWVKLTHQKDGNQKYWYWSNDFSLPISLTNYTFLFSILFLKEVFWLDCFLELHLLHSLSRGLLTASDRAPQTCSFLK